MLFANFINENNPECLYCHDELAERALGKLNILKCNSCEEQFVIDANNNLFGFSCKTLICGIDLIHNKVHISLNDPEKKDSSKKNNLVTVPYFYLNFSHKNKLHKKLKTYMTFS